MPRSAHTYRRQLTSWLAIAVACAAVSGCGHSSRNFLARLSGKLVDSGHTLAGLASQPRKTTAAPDEDAHPHLVRDPFLQQMGAGAIFQTAGQREHSHGSTRNTTSVTAAEERTYLDAQLERLAAAMRESAPRAQPQRDPRIEFPWAFGDSNTGHSTPVSPEELRRKFEQLASREPVGAVSRGWTTGGVAASASSSTRPDSGFESVTEELAPAPNPGESHLAMIVDSQLVPPRSSRRWSPVEDRGAVEFTAGPAFPTLPSDRQQQSPGTTAAAADASIGRTAMAPAAGPPFAREQPVDATADDSAVLPAIELAMNVDAPGPATPRVANASAATSHRSGSRRNQPDYVYRGEDAAGDWTPRTLEPIDFGDRPVPAKRASLSWFPGWLAMMLGVLLVLLAGTALRRGAFRR